MSVIVATFGDPIWLARAAEHAVPSVVGQGDELIRVHGATLAQARNDAAAQATGEWLLFIDADDRIDAGYVEAMLETPGDLRVPRLIEHGPGATVREVHLTQRDIEQVNPCPIGTLIRRDTFLDCGGFPEFRAWEDWALFLRAHRRGASIVHVPRAVYRATVRKDSRNRTVTDARALHAEIRAWA